MYDTEYSLYCQLARITMHENGVSYNSVLVSLPDGDHTTPKFAKMAPKMTIPIMELEDGTVLDQSRAIMKLFDTKCPKSQEAATEAFMDIAFSCDLGWLSTGCMDTKIPLWYVLSHSGFLGWAGVRTMRKLAQQNPELKDIYDAKAKATKRDLAERTYEGGKAACNACFAKMNEVALERKEGEWLTGKEWTRADGVCAVYIQWAMWQNDFRPGTHPISPALAKFFELAKQRECFKKTYRKNGGKSSEPVTFGFVGHYWNARLNGIQRNALLGLAAVAGAAYFWK